MKSFSAGHLLHCFMHAESKRVIVWQHALKSCLKPVRTVSCICMPACSVNCLCLYFYLAVQLYGLTLLETLMDHHAVSSKGTGSDWSAPWRNFPQCLLPIPSSLWCGDGTCLCGFPLPGCRLCCAVEANRPDDASPCPPLREAIWAHLYWQFLLRDSWGSSHDKIH